MVVAVNFRLIPSQTTIFRLTNTFFRRGEMSTQSVGATTAIDLYVPHTYFI